MSTYTPIASQTLSSAAASVTFSSIPQGYTDLVVVCNIYAKFSSETAAALFITFNSDTSSNYSNTGLSGNGSTASSFRYSSQTKMEIGAIMAKNSTSSTVFPPVILNIMNYSNATTNKTILYRSSSEDGTNNTSRRIQAGVGLWRQTTQVAITSFTLSTDATEFVSGSTFSLYGIAGGGYTAKAAGGVVTTSGGYAYHTFTTSGAFTPYEDLSVDYLVVAGGGGATTGSAGGGGAGGYRTSIGGSQLSVKSGTTYPAIVGAGGAGTNNLFHTSGSNSVFATITSTGGGKGGVANTLNPDTGGSGGGGAYYQGIPLGYQGAVGNTPATSPSQGNKGGDGRSGSDPSNPYAPGGGGGAGAAGADATSSGAGAGGIGVSNSISGTATYYAGGGGGGADAQRLPNGNGAGGLGGGGAGGTGSVGPSSGTANTGGGGGGGATGGQTGGSGGSGIVIIRYAL